MLDYHIHSAFSLDADSSMEEYCEAASALGIKELAFTDHLDVDYPHPGFEALLDPVKYKAAVERARERFPEMEIRLGIEAGYIEDASVKTARILEDLEPDFIINSVHVVNGQDPYFIEYFSGKTRNEAYDDYMNALQASLDVSYPYSVIGHIGYVAKKSPFPYPAIQCVDYRPLLDTILYRIIYTGHGIELNASSIKSTNETMPAYSILRRYRELGGEIITYGSDAHNVDDYLQNWPLAKDMLTSAGFRYICGFKRLVPEFNPL